MPVVEGVRHELHPREELERRIGDVRVLDVEAAGCLVVGLHGGDDVCRHQGVARPERGAEDGNAYDEVSETSEHAGASDDGSHRPTLAAEGARTPALRSATMDLRCFQEDA